MKTTRIEKSRSSKKASSEEQLGGDNREALAGGDQVVKQQVTKSNQVVSRISENTSIAGQA